MRVLHGTVDPSLLRGKVVVVGPTAPVLQDEHPTAVGGPMTGPEVQANEVATLLAGLPLRDAPAWSEVVLILAAVLGVCGVAVRFGSLSVALAGATLLAAWCGVVVVAFDSGTVLEFTPEAIAVLLASGGALLIAATADTRERRRLRELFADAEPGVVARVLGDAGPRALAATSVVAGYRMEHLIATGGMGAVYQATQLALGREVAVKLVRPEFALDDEYRTRFKRECRAAAAVEHANVIPVYEAGEDDGLLFIAMRLVAGVDLDALLQRGGALAPRRTARIVEQLAAALDAAHAQGLVHRDVKPANALITLDEPEHVYLTDFGVATALGGASRLTQADHWVGTLDYVAPEQIQGETVDRRADVYALTALLYHCLTGHPPFPRENDMAKLWAHVSAPPPAPSEAVPDLPPEIDAVIARGLAKDPAERYATAGALAAATSAVLAAGEHGSTADQGSPVARPGDVASTAPGARFRRTVVGGATAVSLAAPTEVQDAATAQSAVPPGNGDSATRPSA